jgi:hypothetical protein
LIYDAADAGLIFDYAFLLTGRLSGVETGGTGGLLAGKSLNKIIPLKLPALPHRVMRVVNPIATPIALDPAISGIPIGVNEISALLIKGMNFIEAISSHPHINGGLAEPSLQD